MTVLRDTLQAWRALARTPSFSIPVALSLALAIGANVSAFGIVNTLILRPLPVRDPGSLYQITYLRDAAATEGGNYAWFERVRERARSVSGAFIAHRRSNMHVSADGRIEAVSGLQVSGGFAEGLGLTPQIGRLITSGDERGGTPARVAVLSDAYWTSRFGRDPSVIGKTVVVDNVPHQVVGVTRPGFFGLEVGRRVDVTVPIAAAQYRRGWVTMAIVVRPADGVSAAAASDELTTLLQEFAAEVPARAGLLEQRVALTSISAGIGTQGTVQDRLTRPAVIVAAMLGLMLLLACANWAMLLLARAAARRREMAIHLALGSDRRRLARRMVIESVTLALAGGAIGFAAASWAVAWLPGNGLPPGLAIEMDVRVILFTLGIALLTGMTFAAAPSWLTRRVDAGELRTYGRLDDGHRGRAARVLVVAQVALSVIVVVAAAFFGATLRNLRTQPMGFSADGVVTFTLNADGTGVEGEPLRALHGRILERLRSLPGVQSATLASVSPVSGNEDGKGITVPGFEPSAESDLIVNVNTIAPEYFETYGIAIRRGRALTEADTASGPHVAVVSESAARYYFGGTNPIGRRMEIRGSTTLRPEIVGVAADVLYDGLRGGAERMFYVPFSQRPAEGEYQFAIRTSGGTQALIREIPAVIANVAPTLPLLALEPLSRQIDARAANEWLLATVSTSLGAIALVLAGIGICGIVGYTVARRTAEVGLRVALGATYRHIIWLMARGSAAVVAIGVVIGTAVAFAASDALTDVLFGLEHTDARVYAAAAASLFVAGVLAALPPVIRALRIEPVRALRYE